MSVKQVVVTVAKDGKITTEVNCVKGQGCTDILAALQEAMGAAKLSDEKKAEFYEAVPAGTVTTGY